MPARPPAGEVLTHNGHVVTDFLFPARERCQWLRQAGRADAKVQGPAIWQ